MTSNKKTVILVLVVLAVLLGLVCLLCTKVLRGEKEPTQVKYDDPVQARMHDEKYVAKLNEQLASRKEILKGLSAAKTKLNAAKAKLEEAKNAKASDRQVERRSRRVQRRRPGLGQEFRKQSAPFREDRSRSDVEVGCGSAAAASAEGELR